MKDLQLKVFEVIFHARQVDRSEKQRIPWKFKAYPDVKREIWREYEYNENLIRKFYKIDEPIGH